MMKKYRLGELIEVSRGASLSGEFFAKEGRYIRLTCGNFDYQNNCFKENTSKDNLYYIGEFKEEFLLKEGDIITPLTEQAIGLLGSTALIPESGKYIQSQDVAKVTCNEALLDQNYAFYLLSSALVKQQLSAGAQQTKIRHTSPCKIKDCIVWLPPLTEQKRIGQLLSTIDRKIALNRAINHNLEAMTKQLYDYWFVQFDFPDENGKPYKNSGGKMVWNESLKRKIPKRWKSTTLGDECQMYQPKTLGLSELDESAKYKVYGANGVVGKYHTYNHENSEIAMACRGNSCGTINRTAPFSWITGNAMVIKMIDNSIHNEYIKQALRYANVNGAISGSGQPQLTRENLNSITLYRPTRELLIRFSEQISNIVEMHLQNEANIEELTKQRDELLPLLMNGQVSLNYDLSHD